MPPKAASAEDATLPCARDTEKHESSKSVGGPNNEIRGCILLFFCSLQFDFVSISSLPASTQIQISFIMFIHVRYAAVDVFATLWDNFSSALAWDYDCKNNFGRQNK